VTGGGLTAPICYWQGRMMVRHSASVPMAWTKEWAPFHAILLGLAVLWLVLWLLNAMALHRAKQSWIFSAIPLAAFVGFAYYAAIMAYSCNIF